MRLSREQLYEEENRMNSGNGPGTGWDPFGWINKSLGSVGWTINTGPSLSQWKYWNANVSGQALYGEESTNFYTWYRNGMNATIDWNMVKNIALTFNESNHGFDQLSISSNGDLSFGYTKASLAHFEALAMHEIMSDMSANYMLASVRVQNTYPGRIRWNKKDQAKMAIHIMNWIRYAEATNFGSFDLHAAFSSFTPNIDSGNQGLSVFSLNLAIGGRSFGFAATSALYVNKRGEYNSIVNFNANEQWHQMTGPDGDLWQYNIKRNGKGSSWGTQEYNFVLVNNFLYPND